VCIQGHSRLFRVEMRKENVWVTLYHLKIENALACYVQYTVTHRRRRRDETVELRLVGGVNTPVGSRDPVYNFLC